MLNTETIVSGVKEKFVINNKEKFKIVEELTVLSKLIDKKIIAEQLGCSMSILNGYLYGIKKIPYKRISKVKRMLEIIVDQSDAILRNFNGHHYDSEKYYKLVADARVLLISNNEYRELMTDSDKRLAAISDEFEEFMEQQQ